MIKADEAWVNHIKHHFQNNVGKIPNKHYWLFQLIGEIEHSFSILTF